jgi:hypothetical protein
MNDTPNYPHIWLQPFAGEEGSHTWCQDRQSDEDIEYVRADIAYLAATKPPLAGEVTPVYRVDWENAPRDGTRVLLLSKGTHPDYRVEQRLFWSKHYSIHDLGGCWSDGFVTMSDLDFIGWRFDASPPMPGRGEGFDAEALRVAREVISDMVRYGIISNEVGTTAYYVGDNVLPIIMGRPLAASRPKEDTQQ